MQFNRRSFVLGASAMMATSRAFGQSGSGSPRSIYDEINKWTTDPQNSAYFDPPNEPEMKGSLVLAPSNQAVIAAAKLLASVPTNLPPIGIVKYMIKNFPDPNKMEWPKDTPGHRKPANPVIIAFFAATATKPTQGDQTAWCAALVCWALQHAGLPQPHNAASAKFRSWDGTTKTDDPQKGDLIVFKSVSDPAHGHVTFFDGFVDSKKTAVWCVGGNQSDAINRKSFSLHSKSLELDGFRTATGYRMA